MRLQNPFLIVLSLCLTACVANAGLGQQNPDPKAPKAGPTPQAAPSKPADAKPAKPADAKPAKPTAADLDKQGLTLFNTGKFDEAIAASNQALALNPKDIQAYITMGSAAQRLKRYDQAVKAYQSAIDLNPDPNYYVFLGGANFENQRYPAARSAYQRAAELMPNDYRPYLFIGDTYLREHDYVSAEQTYVEALGFAPDNPQVHFSLGNAYEQENRHADALAEFEVAQRLAPNDSNMTSNILSGEAGSLASLKRYAEAEKIARDLVVKYPKEAFSHSTLGQVLDAANKHDDAIAEYRAAIQITPTDPYLWGNLGWAQYGAARYMEAVESSHKALQMDSTLAYVRFNIGLIYAVLDRWQNAQKEYDQAIAISAPPDVRAGINDVRDAIAKNPANAALKQALDYLTNAQFKNLAPPTETPAPADKSSNSDRRAPRRADMPAPTKSDPK